jgi:hypothetical protein
LLLSLGNNHLQVLSSTLLTEPPLLPSLLLMDNDISTVEEKLTVWAAQPHRGQLCCLPALPSVLLAVFLQSWATHCLEVSSDWTCPALSLSSPITCPTLSAAPAYAEKELPGPNTYTYSVADDYSKSHFNHAQYSMGKLVIS